MMHGQKNIKYVYGLPLSPYLSNDVHVMTDKSELPL